MMLSDEGLNVVVPVAAGAGFDVDVGDDDGEVRPPGVPPRMTVGCFFLPDAARAAARLLIVCRVRL
jgi:hypothetical protein